MARKINKIYLYILILIGLAVAGYFIFNSDVAKDSIENALQGENEADDTEDLDSEPVIFFGDTFSFAYPSGISVIEEDVEGGELILANGGPNEAFQLFIIPFDEAGPITPERIRKDVPDMVIENHKMIEVAGVKALSFEGKDESGAQTFEVWFVAEGKLYQMMGYDEAKKTIQSVLESWEWTSEE